MFLEGLVRAAGLQLTTSESAAPASEVFRRPDEARLCVFLDRWPVRPAAVEGDARADLRALTVGCNQTEKHKQNKHNQQTYIQCNQINEKTHKTTTAQTNKRLNQQNTKDRQTDRQTGRQAASQLRQADKRTRIHRQTDRPQTSQQVHVHMCIGTCTYVDMLRHMHRQ